MADAYDAHRLPPPPLPLPLTLPNRATACGRHPEEQVTGFCASCLRERLARLDPATRRLKPSSSSSGAPAALKSLFFRLPGNHLSTHTATAAAAGVSSSSSSSFLPEFRRCRSFSGGRGAPPASAFEPRRRSCDVRARCTLRSLFHLDDGNASHLFPPPICNTTSANASQGEAEIVPRSLGLASTVLESREEEDEEEHFSDAVDEKPEIEEKLGEEDDEFGAPGVGEKLRPMKDHIDLDAQSKKPPLKDIKEISGSFWLAASVFSKKIQTWRRKQMAKKRGADVAAGKAPASPAIRAKKLPSWSSRRFFRETQSEIAIEDAFGRRSCDTDPRLSLDAGRMSFDDTRHSWHEPRASCDGYLVGGSGGRAVFPRLPPMLSVIEDAPVVAPTVNMVQRSDWQIPVEDDSATPGGSTQTREYYSDSLRRRRSLDRSSSVQRSSIESDEPLPKPASNARVSPTAMANEYFHFHHVCRFERDYKDSTSNALRDECSGSFDSTYWNPVMGGGVAPKKSHRWSKAWSLWSLIPRRGHSRGAIGVNVVERSFSESWPELQREHNGKFFRSNSSVSSRDSFSCGNGGGGLGSIRRNGLENNGHGGKKRREEFVLERNRSARYLPNHVDNGPLRFHLTPRIKGPGKGSHKNTEH